MYQRCVRLKIGCRIFYHLQLWINGIATFIHNVETTLNWCWNVGWAETTTKLKNFSKKAGILQNCFYNILGSLIVANFNTWALEKMEMRQLPIFLNEITCKKLRQITIDEHLKFNKHITNKWWSISWKLKAVPMSSSLLSHQWKINLYTI